jgi:hypothetical protein
MALRWRGEDGRPRAAMVFPPFWPKHEHAVVFWLAGARPSAVQVEPACPTDGFDVLSIEWLLPVR